MYGFVKPGLAPDDPSKSTPARSTGTTRDKAPQESGHIAWMQSRLNAHGAKPTLEIDGGYWKLTAAAVKAFQAANGLKADGEVGAKTWTALAK